MMLLADHGRKRISFSQWKQLSALSPGGFLANCGLVVDEKETYEKYKEYFRQLVEQGMHPQKICGVEKTLGRLRSSKKRLIVLSAHPIENLSGEINEYGLDGMFSYVTGNTTDKATGLIELKTRLGFDGCGLYTGDTIYDIRAAKEAQVKSCAITTGYHSRERLALEKPDHLIDYLAGILLIS